MVSSHVLNGTVLLYRIIPQRLIEWFSSFMKEVTLTIIPATRFRASQVSHLDLLTNKDKSDFNRSFQLSYLSKHIKKLIVKHWHIVSHLPGCQMPPRLGSRKSESIRNRLV